MAVVFPTYRRPVVTDVSAGRKILELPLLRADTSRMLEFARKELACHDEWKQLLATYHEKQLAAKQQDAEHNGWVSRVKPPLDIANEELPRIHGKLIALGLLHFELAGRAAGVQYQVSPLGLRALGECELTREEEPGGNQLPLSA